MTPIASTSTSTPRRAARALRLVAVLATLVAVPAPAAEPPPLTPLSPPPAAASGASGGVDPMAATRAYLAELPPQAKAKSDAYFEGGYWLQLWGFLWSSAALLLLLATGFSAGLRDRCERLFRRRWLSTAAYAAAFTVLTTLLGLPLSVYQDWIREHQYGLSNLTLGAWLGEQGKGLLVGIIFSALGVTLLYAVVRRAPRTWWLWGTGVAVALLMVFALIVPVAIMPLFNNPKRLEDQRVVRPVLALARANGIATHDIWEIDASKQTTRMSANVSGMLGTERITLNDNLLNRASLPEIEAVMGHEIGHYVLNHVYKFVLEMAVIIAAGFALLAWLFERVRARTEARWRVRDIGDVAGLPLASLLLGAYLFACTPLLNTIIRVGEQEADMFGLNAARQPDGFARAALHLAEYRKMEPGPLEEILFYDHPSGRTRILSAMRWKAEHPETWSPPARKAP